LLLFIRLSCASIDHAIIGSAYSPSVEPFSSASLPHPASLRTARTSVRAFADVRLTLPSLDTGDSEA
jgi:hypothetical protein